MFSLYCSLRGDLRVAETSLQYRVPVPAGVPPKERCKIPAAGHSYNIQPQERFVYLSLQLREGPLFDCLITLDVPKPI